jgi:drug/metabolite transporter (DMT)-like permease
MSWVLLAFAAPVLWAISTHIDKYLVEKYFKDSQVGVLLLFTSLFTVLPMLGIWLFAKTVMAGAVPIAVMVASGILYMGAMYFYLGALQTEEASVIAPLFQAAPLFTYALAFIFLGERLTPVQLTGGALIVASVLVISLHGFGKLKTRLLLLMLACTFALAASSVVFKLFAVETDFWITTFWTFAGEVIFGVGLIAIPSYRREFAALFKKHPGAVAAVNGSNELINFGGGLAARYAALIGSVTLVQAISGTTSLFVFVFGVLVSLVAPKLGREDLSKDSLIRKGIAAVLIVIGTVLIGPTDTH